MSVGIGADKFGGNIGKRTELRYPSFPDPEAIEASANQPAPEVVIALPCGDSIVFPLHACRRDGRLGTDRWRLRAIVLRPPGSDFLSRVVDSGPSRTTML